MGTRAVIRVLAFAAAVTVPVHVLAWGDTGHQIIATIAVNHLTPNAKARVKTILANDTFGHTLPAVSTWADKTRTPATAPLHFVDIPRGKTAYEPSRDCDQDKCVIAAIVKYQGQLKDPQTSPRLKAKPLKYLTHFLGDVHQPLHCTTDNDRGGNCVPVDYFNPATHKTTHTKMTDATKEDFKPQLHGVWDKEMVVAAMDGDSVTVFAAKLQQQFRAQIPTWEQGPIDPQAWALESHQLAEQDSYGKLAIVVPVEVPTTVKTCSQDKHVAKRLRARHEQVDDTYEDAVRQDIEEQLTKAGVRLAKVLNDAFP